VLTEGTLHLCVYALGQIAKDAEVTIAFDYEFNSWSVTTAHKTHPFKSLSTSTNTDA